MRLAAAALTPVRTHEAADGEVGEESEDGNCAEDTGMREGMGERCAQLVAQAPDSVGGGEREDGEEGARHLQPEHRGEADDRLDGGGLETADAFLHAACLRDGSGGTLDGRAGDWLDCSRWVQYGATRCAGCGLRCRCGHRLRGIFGTGGMYCADDGLRSLPRPESERPSKAHRVHATQFR